MIDGGNLLLTCGLCCSVNIFDALELHTADLVFARFVTE